MFVPWDKVDPPVIFKMCPYQHRDEENRFQQDENENILSEDPAAAFEQNLVAKLTAFLGGPHGEEQPSGGRHSRPLQDHKNGEQQSGARHPRPLEDPNGGELPSGDRHPRPLEDLDGGELPSGDKTSESEEGK